MATLDFTTKPFALCY
ncbi:unnamed protein product [Debaryomyces fabryi]|nr:unnamed protein product [Debaryomyces fabryi]